jgi:hypothetical protein
MIDIETSLLEMLDWDEVELERLYDKASVFLESCKLFDTGSISNALTEHLHDDIGEDGSNLIFLILDQHIRKEMRIIEE